MSYDNNNRGAIWGNDRKEKDTHPDFKGEATVDGVEYWVSGWKRKPDANPKAPSLSFAFTKKESMPQSRAANDMPERMAPSEYHARNDEDIPF